MTQQLDAAQAEFILTYGFHCMALNPEWTKNTDVDTHFAIAKGIYKLFQNSEYDTDQASNLQCINNFFEGQFPFFIGYGGMEQIQSGDIVITLDGYHHEVVACAKLPDDLRTEDSYWVVIYKHPIEPDSSEIYSSNGAFKKGTQPISPNTIVSIFEKE